MNNPSFSNTLSVNPGDIYSQVLRDILKILREARRDLDRKNPMTILHYRRKSLKFLDEKDDEELIREFYQHPQQNPTFYRVVMNFVKKYGLTPDWWKYNRQKEIHNRKKRLKISMVFGCIMILLLFFHLKFID